MTTILDVRNLKTSFFTSNGEIKAVDDVSFSLRKGDILGLVGESGSGKTITGMSIMGLIESPGRIVSGSIFFNGVDLTRATEKQLRHVRGRKLAMIFQNPLSTLNPVFTVGQQMIETVRAHERVSVQEARSRARDALGQTGIPSPEERLDAYPHELSGGMRQRVAIATALLHQPDLIIADEPTTALDVTIQAQILSEVQQLVRKYSTSLVWVTHDLSVIAGLADHIAVMYAGKIVEYGAVDALLSHPRHPYTIGLINTLPENNEGRKRLYQIPGYLPSFSRLPSGCTFRDRCDKAQEQCRTPAPVIRIDEDHTSRCHFAESFN
jgi:peptide/nickel transport system ATP-binding protein